MFSFYFFYGTVCRYDVIVHWDVWKVEWNEWNIFEAAMFETSAQVLIIDIFYLEFYMYIGIKIRMEGINLKFVGFDKPARIGVVSPPDLKNYIK